MRNLLERLSLHGDTIERPTDSNGFAERPAKTALSVQVVARSTRLDRRPRVDRWSPLSPTRGVGVNLTVLAGGVVRFGVRAGEYSHDMDRKVWTAAELEAMTPAEVDAVFEGGIVWDPADAAPELLAQTRERILRRIENTEPTQRS